MDASPCDDSENAMNDGNAPDRGNRNPASDKTLPPVISESIWIIRRTAKTFQTASFKAVMRLRRPLVASGAPA